jgi:hypothetical protein
VRWGAVATGAVAGAAALLLLLRIGSDSPVLVAEGPTVGHRMWWGALSLLTAALAGWLGATAAGERGIRGAYLHGLLAWAGALLLGSFAGLTPAGVLPAGGWSSVLGLAGATTGAALARAGLAGRLGLGQGLGRARGLGAASRLRAASPRRAPQAGVAAQAGGAAHAGTTSYAPTPEAREATGEGLAADASRRETAREPARERTREAGGEDWRDVLRGGRGGGGQSPGGLH